MREREKPLPPFRAFARLLKSFQERVMSRFLLRFLFWINGDLKYLVESFLWLRDDDDNI